MNPLRVALIVKGSPASLERSNRNMGYWSYPVSEFTWDHHVLGVQQLRRNQFANYDLIFVEDIGTSGSFIGDGPPIVYMAIDSTLSPEHRKTRQRWAEAANLVLVDHDNLSTFHPHNRHVRRLAYCVNDQIFKPVADKTLDVCYHCGAGESRGMPGGRERNEIRALLGKHCGGRYSFVSGGIGLFDYAAHMAAARVVVNWPRTPINRPHRVFDAMASRAALLTGPLPPVDEDCRRADEHYREFETHAGMLGALDDMLSGNWQEYAEAGYQLVTTRHTWAIRAAELREMLHKELGL